MTKGTATRLQLDDAACRAVKPDVIYCNTYAYGLEGPLGHFGGLDPLYQASAGLEHEAGAVPHGHDPLYYRFGMCDAANAMLSVVGVLAALYHQRVTGEGQELWTSLMDGGAVFSSDTLLRADGTPEYRPKIDAAQRGFAPGYRLYETQDGWIQIAAIRDDHWDAFCRATGVAEGHDHAPDRDAVEAQLEAALRTKPSVSWSHLFDDAGVPNEIPVDVQGGKLALYDADVERLGMVVDYEHPIMGAHAPVRAPDQLLGHAGADLRTGAARRRAHLRDPRRARVLGQTDGRPQGVRRRLLARRRLPLGLVTRRPSVLGTFRSK